MSQSFFTSSCGRVYESQSDLDRHVSQCEQCIDAAHGKVTVITGKDNIAFAQLLAWKGALQLELKGLKRHGRSVYSIVKQELGFIGNRASVLAQLEAHITKIANDRTAGTTAPLRKIVIEVYFAETVVDHVLVDGKLLDSEPRCDMQQYTVYHDKERCFGIHLDAETY